MSTHVITYEQLIRRKVRKKVELEHCPFCGEEAEYRRYGYQGNGFTVHCTGCKASLPLKSGADAQMRVTDSWNKRAET